MLDDERIDSLQGSINESHMEADAEPPKRGRKTGTGRTIDADLEVRLKAALLAGVALTTTQLAAALQIGGVSITSRSLSDYRRRWGTRSAQHVDPEVTRWWARERRRQLRGLKSKRLVSVCQLHTPVPLAAKGWTAAFQKAFPRAKSLPTIYLYQSASVAKEIVWWVSYGESVQQAREAGLQILRRHVPLFRQAVVLPDHPSALTQRRPPCPTRRRSLSEELDDWLFPQPIVIKPERPLIGPASVFDWRGPQAAA